MKLPKPVKREEETPGKSPMLTIPVPVKECAGLGDVIKTITGKIGFKHCTGCENRAEILNRLVRFGPMK